ncbi:hypothetical protein [Kitasatospora sp. NPDC050463]|uniref:hypothetical protein n=1 Tax=Kitasatospora sp. NPDC050463 TaxID=3155786 RepID=UPI0033D79D96
MSVEQPALYLPPVHRAFLRATAAAEEEMGFLLAQNVMFEEEYITTLLCSRLVPEVTYVKFSKQQESRVGGDYLWWWVDRSGEAFGCLVQAKVIHHKGRGWRIGFHHETRTGLQMDQLLAASDFFEVLAAYAFYAGDAAYRSTMRCSQRHHGVLCHQRQGAGVTILPALNAQRTVENARLRATAPPSKLPFLGGFDPIEDVFHHAEPLSRLTEPGRANDDPASIRYYRMRLGPGMNGLRELLTPGQIGARKVAQFMTDKLAQQAAGTFETAVLPDVHTDQVEVGGRVFDTLPGARGHFGRPFFEHALRGLRTGLPDYVEAALRSPSDGVPAELAEHADGLVVVYL